MYRTTQPACRVTPVLISMLIVFGLLAFRAAGEVPDLSGASHAANDSTAGKGPGSMVLVPAGKFVMGDGVVYCGKDERRVTLTRAFYLGRYEVTNREYRDALEWAYVHDYVTATPVSVLDNLDGSTRELLDLDGKDCRIAFSDGAFTVEKGKEDYPVVQVSWYGAAAYCDWLSLQQGLPRAYDHSTWQCGGGDPYGAVGYRLLTDAEWEYAAQYNDGRIYPWGNEDPTCDRVSFSDNGFCGPIAVVGSHPAAPASLGLYDMAGNVWEWCNDWHTCDLGSMPVSDPAGPSTGDYRTLRSGAWYVRAGTLRCASRHRIHPWTMSYGCGFRCSRSQ